MWQLILLLALSAITNNPNCHLFIPNIKHHDLFSTYPEFSARLCKMVHVGMFIHTTNGVNYPAILQKTFKIRR